MMTLVDHNATPLPKTQAIGGLTKVKRCFGQYLNACNGELVETCFEWVAEHSFKLLLTLISFIVEATNWF